MSQSLATMVISEPVEWSQNEHEPYLTSGSGFIIWLHQIVWHMICYIRYGTLGMVTSGMVH